MSEETKKTEAAKAPEVQEVAVEATTESTETVEITETTPVVKEESQEDFLKNMKESFAKIEQVYNGKHIDFWLC